ncbi:MULTISPECIES: helix-turn-helix transcriptional regulator [Gammaproteobacteria]|uniref:helix-turn-helix transcriptional regulator n=1 Tax=Gammaproteobacteria TaxID=1236 RepID=UPI000DD05201|nr:MULTISPECIES: AraC family transcriptional regulator [Gammaproteobacteria]RTE86602.1 AraC family transcriptional regulator [Aliidiomarina sp. B3213]TCZ90843.1 AraC family transcriptional regulator [Lysobacter sp. N42]
MLTIDAFFRFSALSLAILLSVIVARDLFHSRQAKLLVATNVLIACFLLGAMPDPFQLPYAIRVPLRWLDTLLLPITWLFVLTLFKRDFFIRTWHLLGLTVLVGSMLAERLAWMEVIDRLPDWWALLVLGSSLLLVGHMLAITLLGRKDDLIEVRRKYRLYLIALIALSMFLAILAGSLWFKEQQTTVNAISVWIPAVAMSLWVLSGHSTALTFYHDVKSKKVPNQAEKKLLSKLESLMLEDKIYLKDQLTIGRLSGLMGVAEHRLRKLINNYTGYENFSSYVNNYRLQDVIRVMSDSENDHLPILTIALNHGFNSLPPFNRAFKKEVGMTPSEFRKNRRSFQN